MDALGDNDSDDDLVEIELCALDDASVSKVSSLKKTRKSGKEYLRINSSKEKISYMHAGQDRDQTQDFDKRSNSLSEGAGVCSRRVRV